jgi:glycosyltransferase involved in cell wall biosynthesis
VTEVRTPILYIAPWVDLGGSDRGTIDWFKHIDRSRWAPSLITTTPSPNRWLHHVEPYAEEIWDLPDLMPGGSFPEFILGFIESRSVRLVHMMNSRLAFDLLPDMTCLPEPPAVVVQLHAEEPDRRGYVRYVTRRYGNLIDSFSVVSENLKQTLVDYEIPPSRIEVIYLGVDGTGEFDPNRVEPLQGEGNGAKRILWPGRLVEQKDPLLTVEVLARAKELGAEFVLDVVGDGHLKEPARALAEQLGVADVIRWHPASQEMARWYRSSDLLLMTSVYEGIPLVIYEALSMGVPVVAPALPGNVEFMDAESGVLVEPRDDVDQYAKAIVSLFADDARRGEMGERSRQRMLAEFSLEEMGRRHDALYERMLAERTASSRWRNEELLGETRPAQVEPPDKPPPLRLPRKPLPERTVGVIVPCYRHGIFIDACVASIKAQTLKPAAIVVIDDGSEDPETIDALARLDRDPMVTVLRQAENRGPSAARNRGLAELETSYMLPIDADDELLPDALERMVVQLERAPEDVGYVYPHAQHVGNREDGFEAPDYNVWLLMEQNYCAAPALFDRRLFEGTGLAYPEEIVVGHEDWDLILQLAERGVRGAPADGHTFLYRKQGFSRVNAVDYGPDAFHKTIERRHPHLYLNQDVIKARWAPALSIVLLDEPGAEWRREHLAGLRRQTCRDFEVICRNALDDGVRVVGSAEDPPLEWLQSAIDEAWGRWVLLLPLAAGAALEASPCVERLIHAFAADEGNIGVVLGRIPGPQRPSFSQLDAAQRQAAEPAAVAFRRPVWSRLPEIRLGVEDSPLADLVVGLQAHGRMQWRAVSGASASSSWLGSGAPVARGGTLDLNLPRGLGDPQEAMRQVVACQEPRLPELTPDTVRRWEHDEPWTPPQTQLLCRHVDPLTGFRAVTVERKSPPGYEFERVLGSVQIFPAPGASRLVHANHSFELTEEQGELPQGHFPLGYVEQQPLPQLESLELRQMPGNGQAVLVAGADDPLLYASEHLAVLGWIEAYPVLPRRRDVLWNGTWQVEPLRRGLEGNRSLHSYGVGGAEGDLVGYLHRHPGEALVALRLLGDGRLASDLLAPGRASRDPRRIVRWLAEPLVWREAPSARARRIGGRLRQLARRRRAKRGSDRDGAVLGYLRHDRAPGTSPLFSTIHPATGDQLVTCAPGEAAAKGYVLEGALGAILDPE